MNNIPPPAPARSVIHRAAENGLYLGLYLSVLALLAGVSQGSLLAGLGVWGLSLYMPFFVYRLLRKSLAERHFEAGFAEMWSEGIALFLLASMIQAVVIYLGLRYLAPDYMARSVDMAIEFFRAQGNEAGDTWVRTLQNLREQNGLPGPTDVAAQIISTNVVGGGFLSIILSAVLVTRYSSAERRQRYMERHGGQQ